MLSRQTDLKRGDLPCMLLMMIWEALKNASHDDLESIEVSCMLSLEQTVPMNLNAYQLFC